MAGGSGGGSPPDETLQNRIFTEPLFILIFEFFQVILEGLGFPISPGVLMKAADVLVFLICVRMNQTSREFL